MCVRCMCSMLGEPRLTMQWLSGQSKVKDRRYTTPQPFKFEHHKALPERPIVAAKLESELIIKRQEEERARRVSTPGRQSVCPLCSLPAPLTLQSLPSHHGT